MKNFLLALMVVLTTCTLAIAQNQTTVVRDSVGKVKVTVTKDNKANTNNLYVIILTNKKNYEQEYQRNSDRKEPASIRMTAISPSTMLVPAEVFW